jgi:hypothetical protein
MGSVPYPRGIPEKNILGMNYNATQTPFLELIKDGETK